MLHRRFVMNWRAFVRRVRNIIEYLTLLLSEMKQEIHEKSQDNRRTDHESNLERLERSPTVA
jgi:hypothetical protein